jgi:Na+-transporting methylmalonyl-CoA/oxaloacetate decarboxylase gamma subunit
MIDWGAAGALAGKGFGTVFAVLVILAVMTWLIGFVSQKTRRTRTEPVPASKAEKSDVK